MQHNLFCVRRRRSHNALVAAPNGGYSRACPEREQSRTVNSLPV
jgi:hypothetical protein